MDKIFINQLQINAIIGINEWERTTPQEILVSITALIQSRTNRNPDDISSCVDYSLMANDIRMLTISAKKFTVEALAEDLAVLCLEKYQLIQKVIIRVEKSKAISNARSAGVEIERSRV